MAQDVILGTDTGAAALLTKINGDLTELFTNQTEVQAARASTVKATTYASLDARLEALETDNATLASGSGVVVSAADTTSGYLASKLLGTSGQVTLTIGNPSGNETLTIALVEGGRNPDLEAISFFNGIAF